MQRIVAYLEDEVVNNLKSLYKDPKSMSKIIAEVIDIGYKVKLYHDKVHANPAITRVTELKEKHTEYLLKIMAIATDIYRCVRNEQSKYSEQDITAVLHTIASNVQNFIESQPDDR